MTKEKTVAEHMKDCEGVIGVVKNANALLLKCRQELVYARDVLEMLDPYQHPKLSVPTSYKGWLTMEKDLKPSEVIAAEIRRINALLGDRA